MNVLNKSSKIAINSKINQEFESFKQELLPRLSSIELKIKELEGEIHEQKKQKCDLENKFSDIDPVLRETISLIDQIEELRINVEVLNQEVMRLKGNISTNKRLDIERIVKEVTGDGI